MIEIKQITHEVRTDQLRTRTRPEPDSKSEFEPEPDSNSESNNFFDIFAIVCLQLQP